MKVMQLPPKMAQQFADKAKRGEADKIIGGSVYLFFQGNNEICLVCLDPPIGHISKRTAVEIETLRK